MLSPKLPDCHLPLVWFWSVLLLGGLQPSSKVPPTLSKRPLGLCPSDPLALPARWLPVFLVSYLTYIKAAFVECHSVQFFLWCFLSGNELYCIKLQILLHDIRSSETFLHKVVMQIGGTHKKCLTEITLFWCSLKWDFTVACRYYNFIDKIWFYSKSCHFTATPHTWGFYTEKYIVYWNLTYSYIPKSAHSTEMA